MGGYRRRKGYGEVCVNLKTNLIFPEELMFFHNGHDELFNLMLFTKLTHPPPLTSEKRRILAWLSRELDHHIAANGAFHLAFYKFRFPSDRRKLAMGSGCDSVKCEMKP
jgi:hypothetical protein